MALTNRAGTIPGLVSEGHDLARQPLRAGTGLHANDWRRCALEKIAAPCLAERRALNRRATARRSGRGFGSGGALAPISPTRFAVFLAGLCVVSLTQTRFGLSNGARQSKRKARSTLGQIAKVDSAAMFMYD